NVIEQQLTVALQEVLDQPDLVLKVEREFKRGGATMSFHIERGGNAEDIMRGQGGSVANVLSVGLRLFALTTLDRAKHRRFLVLDEQDCWLRPDLVPALVKIVRDAGKALGFQVIMISHHDAAIFERYEDRIYRFTPTAELIYAPAVLETGDRDRAEDLVQETFLIAWQKINQVTEPAGFRPWLLTILHSCVVDSVRREGRKKRSGRRAHDDEILYLEDD